jgi:hypothetical protein
MTSDEYFKIDFRFKGWKTTSCLVLLLLTMLTFTVLGLSCVGLDNYNPCGGVGGALTLIVLAFCAPVIFYLMGCCCYTCCPKCC